VTAERIAGAGLAGGDDQEAGGGPLTTFAWRPVFAVAAILAAVLVATSGAYESHRDELYFLACARHLAWGYPDQPLFVPLVARLMAAVAHVGGQLFEELWFRRQLVEPMAVEAVADVRVPGVLVDALGVGRQR